MNPTTRTSATAHKSPARVRAIFGREGRLAQWHPDFEFRAGQLAMAEEVEAALAEKRHLLVEAGTGTGKTLAYLVPVIASGKRVVISTGTKNLQEQLYYKDIPFLEKHTGHPLKIAYMKGRANFLCRRKLYDAEKRPVLNGLVEIEDFAMIREWEKRTETGDRAELRKLPEDSTVWAKLDARRDLCSGQKCDQFDRCFITLMHQRAREADIIIVNHHLFFADLHLREDDFGSVIPDYQAVVFDEAHEIEDVAGQHFGIQISNYRFDEMARDIQNTAFRAGFGSKELDRALEAFRIRFQAFFELFEGPEGRSGFRDRAEFAGNEKEYSLLRNALEMLGTQLQLVTKQVDEIIPLHRRVGELERELRFLIEGDDQRYVYWIERRRRGVFLQATPIDVSEVLAERLFNHLDTVVLTSATLAVSGNFDFMRARLGINSSARELVVPGHFDWRSQVLFYVPPGLPEPRAPQFVGAAAEEILRVLKHSRGRAFVLFTSYQQMRAIHDIVSFALEYPTLLQGTAPNSALLDEFRNTKNCVLFATASFWQGVDVPGEQLSCVVIDKLPFAVPSDPIVEARIRSLRQAGSDPFFEYQIPQAVISLKQGFGRLIRNRKDRGALVLLDNRILKQRYGKIFQKSLPDYTFTTSIEDVEKFFEA